MAAHEVYLANQDFIERALKFVCGRQHLSGPDAEDFCSTFRLRLIEGDCDIIRKFQGRCSIQTYLVSVITHFFQDWRNARWGKWRPSAEARRLGEIAIELETLCVRDQIGFEAACELLCVEHPSLSRTELERIAARLPSRHTRAFVPESRITDVPSMTPAPDAALLSGEAADAAQRATDAMRAAVASLTPQEQLIVRMLVEEDLSVAAIARSLSLDQKPLYRRIQHMFTALRAQLESQGFEASVVADVIRHRGFDAAADALAAEIQDEVRLFSRKTGSSKVKGLAR